jgi:phage terminase large subunit
MDIKIPYTPRKHQKLLHQQIDKHRWSVLVCHRRFGKTVCMINHLIKSALMCKEKNPRFAYLAPTFKQAKSIAWDYMKQFTDKEERGQGLPYYIKMVDNKDYVYRRSLCTTRY